MAVKVHKTRYGTHYTNPQNNNNNYYNKYQSKILMCKELNQTKFNNVISRDRKFRYYSA